MSLVVKNNLMAANTARNLNTHYGRLATSTQRLSSGLRINGAADDAAGLAIRELMRADIAALNQGVRNANDAISMLQVADGALGIIDEKLIRMKELAEQAATGTYNSTQRLMIDSEFQAMASEINRIARATDFNGIKLLDGSDKITIPANITLNQPTVVNINTITNESGSYSSIDGVNTYNEYTKTITKQGTQTIEYFLQDNYIYKQTTNNININTITKTESESISGEAVVPWEWASGTYELFIEITDKSSLDLIDQAPPLGADWGYYNRHIIASRYEHKEKPEDFGNDFVGKPHFYYFDCDLDGDGKTDVIYGVSLESFWELGEVERRYRFDHMSHFNRPAKIEQENTFDTHINVEQFYKIGNEKSVKIHFGPMNDSAEDYYDIEKRDCTLKGLGLEDTRIETQDNAQKALVTINDAIVKKDEARAYYGAMQNRLENTVSNLSIQAENLQASESRISDVDVATEMTNFVRNQILTQSAVAMLSQANTLPQMAMQLIGG